MNVALPPDLERFLDELVEKGEVGSRSDAVALGLRLLKDGFLRRDAEIKRVRGLLQEGLDSSARGESVDGETFMREQLARYEDRAVPAHRAA